jgi:KaiC/GvpD/RAD55 family RecA-like ATPase
MSAIQPAIEPAGAHQHQVQLYGCDETFLIKNVSRYICEGLSRGEGVLVLGTPEHVDGFMRGLSALGVDVEAAIERKQLAFPDAAETLDSFLIDGQPDGDRF